MPLWLKIQSIIKELSTKAVELWNGQRKLILMGLNFIGILIIGLIVISWALSFHPNFGSNSSSPAVNEDIKPLTMRQEEFFLSDEPDFLPKVLLEREPRNRWTPDDVRFFWKEPAEKDSERWRESIERVIDELLEGVP